MNSSWVLKGLGIGAVAFFISRCDFFGINPLVIGFFVAVCLLGDDALFAYVGAMVGLITTFSLVHIVRYGIIMLIIATALNSKNLIKFKGKELIVSFFAGVLSLVVSLVIHVMSMSDTDIIIFVIEGAIIFSVGMIYYYAVNIIKNDYVRIATENEAAISCLFFGASILLGIPVELPGGIMPAETVAILSVLIVMYKFGFGIGICWTVVAGAAMTYLTGLEGYFTGWIIVGVATFGLSCVFGNSRFVFGMLYSGAYLLIGTYFYDVLLDLEGLKALAGAMLIFLLAPRRVMLKIDDSIRSDMLSANSPEWGRLIIDRINNLSMAFKRIEYTLAGNVNTGIGFKDVGNIIDGFTNQLERAVPMRKTIESNIIQQLGEKDIHVKNLLLIKNQDERYEVYITSKVRRGKLVMASVVRDIISKEIGIDMELKSESRNIVSRNYEMICMREKPAFGCKTAVRCMSKYEGDVSGDNFYVGDILDGQKLILLADGMGNGKDAAGDSTFLIDSIEELLMAGFDKETSIRIVNTYLADKNKGERFSTLDMLILDLHTGYGRLYKQGAATSFVKRGEWIELIKSTSLPMGVIEGAVCESCKKKFYNNDIIIMVSDGIMESIVFENKEDYLRDLILNNSDEEPEDIATSIVENIRAVSGNRLKDDASIIVIKLFKP